MNIVRFLRFVRSLGLLYLALFLGLQPLRAGSATWNSNPASGDWNDPANWTPTTVPNGPDDVATFSASNRTGVSLSANTEVTSIVFSAGASAFTITASANTALTLSGLGVDNKSGVSQSFLTAMPASSSGFGGIIKFLNQASAGNMTLFTNKGSKFTILPVNSGLTEFDDSSTAGNSTIINEDGPRNGDGGQTIFHDHSTAGDGMFTNEGNTTEVLNARGGEIFFFDESSAGNGTFSNEGGSAHNALAGYIEFAGSSTAAQAAITNSRGVMTGDVGGETLFMESSTASTATLIEDGGALGFQDDSDGASARVETLAGTIEGGGGAGISLHDAPGTQIGSLEGPAGLIVLGDNNLTIGSNNLSTSFAGIIVDYANGFPANGSVSKIGSGTLTLSSANTYTGGTTLTAGALVLSNTSGSATGTGSVSVNGGTLGGGGVISGAVTVGSGSGAGATLQPSLGTTKKVALTIQGQLTFKSDATYSYRLKNRNAEVIANGITIGSGAQFVLTAPTKKLPAGKSATVIKNTAASAISGTFANLPDGGTITGGSNTFLASYEGGDGNDLTLTVLP